ncbi:MAG: hypothetical protein LBQ90_09645, partial [Synergistaceae bacterium]|nr:hypothetical protein [Synergistaceae bacterium]
EGRRRKHRTNANGGSRNHKKAFEPKIENLKKRKEKKRKEKINGVRGLRPLRGAGAEPRAFSF